MHTIPTYNKQINRYPAKDDCPSYEYAVNPEAEDEPWMSRPYSMDNYYYPDFSENNCGYGRDYPAWMGKFCVQMVRMSCI